MKQPIFTGPTYEYIDNLDNDESREREERLQKLKNDIEDYISKEGGDADVKLMLKQTLDKVNEMLDQPPVPMRA